MQTNNLILEHSILVYFFINHVWYFVIAGALSYNLPLVFKLKLESGYHIRAGLMMVMSMALPCSVLLSDNSMQITLLQLISWGLCFIFGLTFATYGARVVQAKFSLLLSRFTVKSSVRRGAKTDIRYMERELPSIPKYNPMKYVNLKKGVFIGLDEHVKPIYLQNADDWYKRHFLIVGATRSGKGVAMQYLGVQSLMLGETIIFLDPKGDKYMPHIFKAQCDKLGVAYTYIDLTQDTPQINLIADFTARDLKNCLVESFSQREVGSESDVYRKNEQEFLENLASFMIEQNHENIHNNHRLKSLAELCADYDIARYADKYKSSVSDLNKLLKVAAINAATGKSLSELFETGGCIYIVGDLLDETMKKIQRFIFCRFVQLSRNHANYTERTGAAEKNVTVFADEFVAHVSRFVAESFTVSLGWNLKIVSAIQDLKLLKGAPADIDPEFLKGAVFGNSQNKLFYRADDVDTADFLSDMTGRIQIDDEQKLITRNSLNSEKLDRQTRLTSSERNYFDRNMILNLKQFEAVFCASLEYRNTIACLCKTSPVEAPRDVDGKEIIQVDDSDQFINRWQSELTKHNALIDELKQDEVIQPVQQNHLDDYAANGNLEDKNNSSGEIQTKHNIVGENNANSRNKQSSNNQDKKASTSKPDYLF